MVFLFVIIAACIMSWRYLRLCQVPLVLIESFLQSNCHSAWSVVQTLIDPSQLSMVDLDLLFISCFDLVQVYSTFEFSDWLIGCPYCCTVNTYTTSYPVVNYLCLFLLIVVDKLERFTCMFS